MVCRRDNLTKLIFMKGGPCMRIEIITSTNPE